MILNNVKKKNKLEANDKMKIREELRKYLKKYENILNVYDNSTSKGRGSNRLLSHTNNNEFEADLYASHKTKNPESIYKAVEKITPKTKDDLLKEVKIHANRESIKARKMEHDMNKQDKTMSKKEKRDNIREIKQYRKDTIDSFNDVYTDDRIAEAIKYQNNELDQRRKVINDPHARKESKKYMTNSKKSNKK